MNIDEKKTLVVELKKPFSEKIGPILKGLFYVLIITAFFGSIFTDKDPLEDFEVRYTDFYGSSVVLPAGISPDAHVAIVDIKGMIANNDMLTRGMTSSNQILKMLEKIKEDDSIKALVLRIDSGGGTVIDSDKIAQKVLELKEKKKVYALIEAGGMSGAYYIASQADMIFAHRESMVGSIGVIMQLPNASELMNRLGIEMKSVTSGDMKDMASPFTPFREKDLEVLQIMINESYERFVDIVSSGRNIDREKVKEIADGRIYSATQAKELGLIDNTDGLKGLRKQITEDKLSDAYIIEFYVPESPFANLFSSLSMAVNEYLPPKNQSYKLMYR
ncbi:MAG: signal peptide peptidase SppA [Candidatus Gracilibacteria bacterium]|jgi:protease-4|nr:signal peptide peptidase SppA [Candidatus Gracilibacteria bacterium]